MVKGPLGHSDLTVLSGVNVKNNARSACRDKGERLFARYKQNDQSFFEQYGTSEPANWLEQNFALLSELALTQTCKASASDAIFVYFSTR